MSTPKSAEDRGHFLCVECGSTFIHQASLLRHRMRFHITGHKCTICNNEVKYKSASNSLDEMKSHMLSWHNISTFYSCGCCSWIFRSKIDLHVHCKSFNATGEPGRVFPIATVISSNGDGSGEDCNPHNTTEGDKEDIRKQLKHQIVKPKRKTEENDDFAQFINNYMNQSDSSVAGNEQIVRTGEPNEHIEEEKEAATTDTSAGDMNLIVSMFAKSLETARKLESKDVLQCKNCGATFSNKSSLYRHSIKTHLDSHICCLCQEEIRVSPTDGSDNMMRRHMLKVHDIQNVYTCSCCFWAFDNKKDLYSHNHSMNTVGTPGDSKKIAISKKKDQASVACAPKEKVITPAEFSSWLSALKFGVKPTLEDSKIEKKDSDNSSEILKALSKNATVSKDVKSSYSPESADDASSADELIMDLSSCDEDETTKDSDALGESTLEERVQSDVTLKRPDLKGQFQCQDCGKQFCHSTSLNRHRGKVHVYDFECILCDKENVKPMRIFEMRQHQETVHANPIRGSTNLCSCCNWVFDTKTSLKNHITLMTDYGIQSSDKCFAKAVGCSNVLLSSTPNQKKKKSKSNTDGVLPHLSSFVAMFCANFRSESDQENESSPSSSKVQNSYEEPNIGDNTDRCIKQEQKSPEKSETPSIERLIKEEPKSVKSSENHLIASPIEEQPMSVENPEINHKEHLIKTEPVSVENQVEERISLHGQDETLSSENPVNVPAPQGGERLERRFRKEKKTLESPEANTSEVLVKEECGTVEGTDSNALELSIEDGSLSPKLDAESFYSSLNDISVDSYSSTQTRRVSKEPVQKRKRIDDIASLLLVKKMKNLNQE